MLDDVRLVLQLLTPILFGLGVWILTNVSGRIAKIEETISGFNDSCERRHGEMWRVIRTAEREISHLKGRMNGGRD